jgi:hypothetical protein
MDERNGNFDIYAQRYANDGTASDTNFRVTNTGEERQGYPDVKMRHNRIYTIWEDRREGKTDMDIWANVLDWNYLVGQIDDEQPQLPTAFLLHQNYPNPFNPTTAIGYRLSAVSDVELSIYNLLGQEVVILVDEKQNAGNHQVEWDASGFAGGIYYYRIKAGEFHDVKKMTLIR